MRSTWMATPRRNEPQRSIRTLCMLAGIVLWSGCGLSGLGDTSPTPASTPTSATPVPTPTPTPAPTASPIPARGTLALSFQIDPLFIYDSMEEPADGIFYGAIFRLEDVTFTGPNAGAQSLEDIEVMLDLTQGGGPSEAVYTTQSLPEGTVVILGFMDSDDNAPTDAPCPDLYDPSTYPWDNEFEVIGDTESLANVFFGILNPVGGCDGGLERRQAGFGGSHGTR